MSKTLHIFGVTGSVGDSVCDVVLSAPGRFDVRTVSANGNAQKLAERAKALGAKRAVLADEAGYEALKDLLAGSGIECAAGAQALADAACEAVDLSVMAIMGMAGLRPLWAALEHSGAIAIANKEPLVAAGPLVMEKARRHGVTLLPLDSEHNAIFQVFEYAQRAQVRRLILTASGGPFRSWSLEQMAGVQLEQALKHPNWSMGAKITIDSATMMNKGLEVIEAHILFDMPADQIEVVVHPQSVIHSMVEYSDGSVLCQMGASDMRTPVAFVLGWPERMASPGERLDFTKVRELNFEAPDLERFPALRLSYDCLRAGLAPRIVMNAANEVFVDAFLQGRLSFLDIVRKTDYLVHACSYDTPRQIADVLAIDNDVRGRAKQVIV